VSGARPDKAFGALVEPDGRVRFRLWAPALTSVFLRLEDADRRLLMTPTGEGWFELQPSEIRIGSRYRFELPDGTLVPDPASRRQDQDVNGPSVVVDPAVYRWRHADWRGRPWHEAVIYELHVGSFSPEGDFAGVGKRLPALKDLGITAVQLMPIADFPGGRNWGYDGVLPYAPDTRYGTPEDLKALVDTAHGLGLMIFLDVVYNHFGPEGNHLHSYAPHMFTDRHHTPWGSAIDFSRRPVRDFFVGNAAYWIAEFRFDGLRLDAVHAIIDETQPHILEVIAAAAREAAGAERQVHLILENEENAPRLLDGGLGPRRDRFEAQWNDDFHHAAHVLLTGETAAYYKDYAERPVALLGRSLAEGFAYQGEISAHRKKPRGAPSAHLPPTAFVDFLQNHDQIGNRGFGERLTRLSDREALCAMMAILLLAPSIPMLFMGEEHGASEPFLFFVDFNDELCEAVRKGRRRELERFPGFHGNAAQPILDPCAKESRDWSAIDWSKQAETAHAKWLSHCRELLALRAQEIVPRLGRPLARPATYRAEGDLLTVNWVFGCGDRLTLLALPAATGRAGSLAVEGRPLWTSTQTLLDDGRLEDLPPWFVGWFLAEAGSWR
jgi:maltooligosyltrehalose trehalohydrolase